MKKKVHYISLLPEYLLILTCFLMLAVYWSRTVTVMSVNAPVTNRKTVIIDAGHGGIDGGAISYTGIPESQFNLEFSLKLNDFLHLIGIDTVMIRETDCSVYTQGETIAQKKISDLKERVRIINNTPNALLVSIHQNQFSSEKYSGAQVFYAPTKGSESIATALQSALVDVLDPDNHRKIKKADGVYLMQNISCPAVLVECGFISNPQEEYLLRDKNYQQKFCCVIGCVVSTQLFDT